MNSSSEEALLQFKLYDSFCNVTFDTDKILITQLCAPLFLGGGRKAEDV